MQGGSALLQLMAFAETRPGQAWMQFVPIVLIFAVFYFLLIAPMRRRQKALQRTVEALKKGDKVVTTGGLYGEVAGIEGGTILLRVADNVKVRVARSAIAGLEGGEEQGAGR